MFRAGEAYKKYLDQTDPSAERKHNKGKTEISQLKERISRLERRMPSWLSGEPMVYSQLANTHQKAIVEVEKLNEKLKNGVTHAYYAQLKREMVDQVVYNRLREEMKKIIGPAVYQQLQDDMGNMIAPEVYDQLEREKHLMIEAARYNELKEKMVDRAEYDMVCRELEQLRLERTSTSRISSTSSILRQASDSYSSSYGRECPHCRDLWNN